jgi:hypothetical protein
VLHNHLHIILLTCFNWINDIYVLRLIVSLGFVDNLKWGHVSKCMSCATNGDVSLDVFSKTYLLWLMFLHLCKTNTIM